MMHRAMMQSTSYKVTEDGKVWFSPGCADVLGGRPVVFAGSAKAARRVGKRIREERKRTFTRVGS